MLGEILLSVVINLFFINLDKDGESSGILFYSSDSLRKFVLSDKARWVSRTGDSKLLEKYDYILYFFTKLFANYEFICKVCEACCRH